jgi:hypothetical protein
MVTKSGEVLTSTWGSATVCCGRLSDAVSGRGSTLGQRNHWWRDPGRSTELTNNTINIEIILKNWQVGEILTRECGCWYCLFRWIGYCMWWILVGSVG